MVSIKMLTLLPQRCHLCRISFAMPSKCLCHACHADILWRPPKAKILDTPCCVTVQSATLHQLPYRQIIYQYKYQQARYWLPMLYYALHQLPIPVRQVAIVPMSSSDARIRQRGFDHVYILARHLARHWHCRLWTGLKKIDERMPQRGLSRGERLSNLKGSFAVTETLPQTRLVILDDVFTTGATIMAASHALYVASRQQQQPLTDIDAVAISCG